MQPAILLGLLCIVSTGLSSTCPTIFLQLSNCSVPGTSVDSWGLKLTLANPSQFVCVVPSTVVNSTLLLSSDFCGNYPNITAAQCESTCGNTFNISAAGTSYSASTPGAILAPNPVWSQISPQPLLAGDTLLQLTLNETISEYPVGIIGTGIHQNVGHLGLATDSDFLRSAVSNGLIAGNGFGLNAGSQSIVSPRVGGLVLGGYDSGSIGGAFSSFPISDSTPSERKCPLQVDITQLVLRFPISDGFSDVPLTSSGIIVPACIEPYDNLFRLPQTLLQSFQQKTSWSSNTTVDPNLYVPEPGLYYPQSQPFNGSLIFTLSNGLQVEVPNEEMSNPLRGIDVNGKRILEPNVSEVNIFYQEAPLSTATLGKKFLSQVYLVVDYSNNKFMLAPMVSSPTYINPVSFNSTSTTCGNIITPGLSRRDKGLIAGFATLGGLGIFSIIGFAMYRHVKKRRNREIQRKSASNA